MRKFIVTVILILLLSLILVRICIDRSNETIERIDRHIEEVTDE